MPWKNCETPSSPTSSAAITTEPCMFAQSTSTGSVHQTRLVGRRDSAHRNAKSGTNVTYEKVCARKDEKENGTAKNAKRTTLRADADLRARRHAQANAATTSAALIATVTPLPNATASP